MILYPFNSLCHNSIPNIIILLIIFLPIVIASLLFVQMLYKSFNEKFNDNNKIFAMLCYIPIYGVIAVGVTYSLFIRPVFIARYMHCAVGLYFLGISIALSYLEKKNMRKAIYILFIISITYGYAFNFQREYCTGTEDTLSFMSNSIKSYNTQVIVTDVHLLSTTVLKYYEPDYKLYNVNEYDIYSEKKKIFYIADAKKTQLDFNRLRTENINYKKIYTGDIDNEYYFDVYLIYV